MIGSSENGRQGAGGGRLSTNLVAALVGGSIALLPFLVSATGWATLYLSAAVRGTDAGWQSFTEVTRGTVIGYGLTVLLLPLLAQPFFVAITTLSLTAGNVFARVAPKVARCLAATRLLSNVHERLGLALRSLRWPVNLRFIIESRPEIADKLEALIRVLDHDSPSRPYRFALTFVVAPALFAVSTTASCVAMLAIAHPGSHWVSPLLSLTADATGYAGAGVFVAALAVLAVPFSGGSLLPRVTSWMGVLAATVVLYVFMVFSTLLSIVA